MTHVKAILARLQAACDPNTPIHQCLLLPGLPQALPSVSDLETTEPLTLVVGYSGSAKSQAALDLAFYVAHQMRLATSRPVVIHAVYVLNTLKRNTAALEEVDGLLWQARCLAEEWRGFFSVHLRFGNVASELAAFATEQNAHLLFLGCHKSQHPRVQQLAPLVSCPVLGIPVSAPAPSPNAIHKCKLSPRSNAKTLAR